MKKEMKYFKGENAGRSMTEMLGVLAIIGVLSLGGIIGYKLAINRYAANQIAYEMNMMKTDAKVKIMQGNDTLTLGQPYDGGTIRFGDYVTTFGCSFIKDADAENIVVEEAATCQVANAYYIELQNIPEGICKPLANLINNMNDLIAFDINPKENGEVGEGGDCEEGENVLNAVFSAEPGDLEVLKCDPGECPDGLHCLKHLCVECSEDTHCGRTGHCENNACEYCESGVWDSATKQCVDCLEKTDCKDNPKGEICENKKCIECTTHAECLALGKDPHCHKATGKCESCPDGSSYELDYQACVIYVETKFFVTRNPSCTKITPAPFGPYTHSYEIWGHGTIDDCLELYVNSNPDTSDMNQCQTGFKARKCCCGEKQCRDYCSDFSLDELKAGDYGNLVVLDPVTWGSWGMSWVDETEGTTHRNDGKIWLILKDE